MAVSLLKTLVTDSWTSSTRATVSVASAAVSSSEAALAALLTEASLLVVVATL